MKNRSRQAIVTNENLPSKPGLKKADEKVSKGQHARAFGMDITQMHVNHNQKAPSKPIATSAQQSPEMEYREQIIRYLSSTQRRFSIPSRTVKQMIKLSLRSAIVLFMQEFCSRYSLRKDTLFFAVHLFDRFVSACLCDEEELEDYAYACLLIAMKYHEIYPPLMKEYAAPDQFKTIIQCESNILKRLNFDLTYDGPSNFLNLWCDMLNLPETDVAAVQILLVLFLFDDDWSKYPAAVVAMTGISLYSRMSEKKIDTSPLEIYASKADVEGCMKKIAVTINTSPNLVKAIRKHYTSESWLRLFPEVGQ